MEITEREQKIVEIETVVRLIELKKHLIKEYNSELEYLQDAVDATDIIHTEGQLAYYQGKIDMLNVVIQIMEKQSNVIEILREYLKEN